MIRLCRLQILLFMLGMLMPAFAQSGKVIVEYPASKELKRTAHRLRISIEQLKNAREALRDAAALLKGMDPTLYSQPYAFTDMWIQLHRSKAFSNIESVYDGFRIAARKAADVNEYQKCTTAAQSLVSLLFELDSERTIALLERWPKPSASLGESAQQIREQMIAQMRLQSLERLVSREPERALELAAGKESFGTTHYAMRARLAQQLLARGSRDKALDLVDQSLADFRRNPDPNALKDYASFVQQISQISPERFFEAFDLLAGAAAKPANGPQNPVFITIGSEILKLDSSEAAVLDVFRGLCGRPELMVKSLAMFPSLKNKVERVGGLDNVLNPAMAAKAAPVAAAAPPPGSSGAEPPISADQLYRSLRGKYEKDPALVRSKLAEVAKDSDLAEVLVGLADRACYEDPELSSAALEFASPLVPLVKPLERRSALLRQLVRLSRQANGEVEPKLLREGFIVADQLRDEEKDKNPSLVQRTRLDSMADQLEIMLVSQLAIDDFPTAIRFVRSMPDDVVKYYALMGILQSLRNSY